jgi:hypothetical protein
MVKHKDPVSKVSNIKRAGVCGSSSKVPSKLEALNSTPSTTKKEKK